MKKTRRTAKVGEVVRDALVEVFRRDVRDIDLSLVSITGVEVSPDMRYARVFVSGLDDRHTSDVVGKLKEQAGRIRAGLGRRVRLRYTPELEFRHDETTMRASRVEELLQRVMPNGTTNDEHDRDDEDPEQ